MRIYHPYNKWECYNNGMWEIVSQEQYDTMLKIAIDFTSNHIEYGKAMREVIKVWTYSMQNHMTDIMINRKAYLGHCAVCYKLGIPEYITRAAWAYLTEEQQILANKEAEITIKIYEEQNKRIHKNMGKQMLLFWNP